MRSWASAVCVIPLAAMVMTACGRVGFDTQARADAGAGTPDSSPTAPPGGALVPASCARDETVLRTVSDIEPGPVIVIQVLVEAADGEITLSDAGGNRYSPDAPTPVIAGARQRVFLSNVAQRLDAGSEITITHPNVLLYAADGRAFAGRRWSDGFSAGQGAGPVVQLVPFSDGGLIVFAALYESPTGLGDIRPGAVSMDLAADCGQGTSPRSTSVVVEVSGSGVVRFESETTVGRWVSQFGLLPGG